MTKHFFILTILLCVSCSSKSVTTSSNQNTNYSRPLTKNSIYFNSDEIDPIDAEEIISTYAKWLKAKPEQRIILEGHADQRGSSDYNLELGDKRARVIMSQLMNHQVSPEQIVILSYGEKKPIDKSLNPKNWDINRRVDLILE